MALQKRIPRKEEFPTARAEDGFDKEDQAREQKFLRDLPHLKSHLGNFRMYTRLRKEFSDIRTADPQKLRFWVVHPEKDIAFARAFDLEPGAENITWFHETRGERDAYENRGHQSKKGEAYWHVERDKADIVVILDGDIDVTRYLLRNVLPGGYIALPVAIANEVLATGDYDFKCIIERHGSNAHVVDGKDAKFWEEEAASSNEDFKRASEKLGKNEHVVTYDEAFETLERADRPTDNVAKEYMRLVDDAKKQKQNISNPNAKVLRYVTTIDKVETIVPVKNRPLPLVPKRNSSAEQELAVFRKHETV